MESIFIANKFLEVENLVTDTGQFKLLHFNNYYLYENNHWRMIKAKEIHDRIIRRIRGGSIRMSSDFHTSWIKDVVRVVESLTTINNCKFGSYLNREAPLNTHLIPVENGILNVTSQLGELVLNIEPHTPDFFATYVLPYRFDVEATCHTFLKFLSETLSPEEIILLQEWFGYQLIPATLGQKFMVFYGSGANGKSVVCLLLRLMLGEENVSSVPLQGFHSGQRFALAATEGKLANIIEEIDELKTFPTARLKSFVVGEPLSIEKKFKDDYLMTPTARLTFATNTLPRFRDKSDGLKRRMIILAFVKQILDESKQDKRLVDKNFWLESGELSGVLNWALIGLKRLMANNWMFTIPDSVKTVIENYNRELNPTLHFLEDYVEINPREKIFGPELYSRYVDFCRESGFVPEDANVFGRAVAHQFRGMIVPQKNPVTVNSKRGRHWYGIQYRLNPANLSVPTDDECREIEAIAQTAQVTQMNSINLNEPLKAEAFEIKKGAYES
jgi:P4 family phage/plasmid primase-like protien